MQRACLRILAINEHGPTAGIAARLKVAPSIADHKGLRQIDATFIAHLQYKARLRLSARTGVAIIMIAGQNPVDAELGLEASIDGFDSGSGYPATSDIRLVRHYDQIEPCMPEFTRRLWYSGKNLEFREIARRVGGSLAYDGKIEDTIAVEKNSARDHCTCDSHLV
jgi:hypothetical protein